MAKTDRCPECGSRELGQGVFSGYANLSACNKKGRPGFRSSAVTAIVCSNCGLVVELRVKDPEKFTPPEREKLF